MPGPETIVADDRLSALRDIWEREGMVRIDDALPPGLAAELATFLPNLPLAPRRVPEHVDLSWSYELVVPVEHDPQHPACLYRLARFLDHDLPALVRRLTDRQLSPPQPRTVHVWELRRGAHVDRGVPLGPDGSIDVVIGLTGPRWPVEWGGHLEVGDRTLAPGFATVDLFAGRSFRIPLVERHVRALAVRTFLS